MHPSLWLVGFVRIEVTTQQEVEETKAEALKLFIENAAFFHFSFVKKKNPFCSLIASAVYDYYKY